MDPTIEHALRALVQAVTSLANTLRASDSRHASGQGAILARLDEIREALVSVLVALKLPAPRNGHGVYMDGDDVTARFPRAAAVTLARRAAPVALAALSALAGWLWRHLVH